MPEQATVLLVEDEIFTRRMMQIYFENDGYQVEQASNATQALECLENKVVDIVLSDIMMPEISGLEMLQKIREKYSKEALPVIMVTGLDDTKQILKAIELGANDFMTKTKEFRIVLSRVALHLDWKRLKQNATGTGDGEFTVEPDSGAWTWHLNGGEVQFSDRWKAILGFDGEHGLEARIDEWLQRIHPEDFDRISEALGQVQEGKRPSFEETYRIQAANQSYIWVKSFGVVIFSDDSQPEYMAGSLARLKIGDGLAEKRSVLKTQIEALQTTLEKGGASTDQEPETFQNRFLRQSGDLLKTLATFSES